MNYSKLNWFVWAVCCFVIGNLTFRVFGDVAGQLVAAIVTGDLFRRLFRSEEDDAEHQRMVRAMPVFVPIALVVSKIFYAILGGWADTLAVLLWFPGIFAAVVITAGIIYVWDRLPWSSKQTPPSHKQFP